jgi:hypothetical protein
VVFIGVTHRSQLRGQLRIRRAFAPPHRIPFSFQPHVRRLKTISYYVATFAAGRQFHQSLIGIDSSDQQCEIECRSRANVLSSALDKACSASCMLCPFSRARLQMRWADVGDQGNAAWDNQIRKGSGKAS